MILWKPNSGEKCIKSFNGLARAKGPKHAGIREKRDFEALEPILVSRVGRFGELNGGSLLKMAAVSDTGRAGKIKSGRIFKNY